MIIDAMSNIVAWSPGPAAPHWLTCGRCLPREPEQVHRNGGEHAADGVVLTASQLDRLNSLEPAAGERHDEANMASIDR